LRRGCFLRRLSAGTRPGRRPTFFASPKKVGKERRPRCLRPFASLRATCGARFWRGLAELASLRCAQTAASPDPPKAALLGAARGDRTGHRCARPRVRLGPSLCSALGLSRAFAFVSPGLSFLSPLPEGEGADPQGRAERRPVSVRRAERSDGPNHIPSGCAEERRGRRDQGRSCLSATKWSEFCGPPLSPSTAGCPERSAGTQTAGSPSFAYFSWRDKKSKSPAGARPGQQPSTRRRTPNRTTPSKTLHLKTSPQRPSVISIQRRVRWTTALRPLHSGA